MEVIIKCPITPTQSNEIKEIVCHVMQKYYTSLNIEHFKGIKILSDETFLNNVMASMDNGWIKQKIPLWMVY